MQKLIFEEEYKFKYINGLEIDIMFTSLAMGSTLRIDAKIRNKGNLQVKAKWKVTMFDNKGYRLPNMKLDKVTLNQNDKLKKLYIFRTEDYGDVDALEMKCLCKIKEKGVWQEVPLLEPTNCAAEEQEK